MIKIIRDTSQVLSLLGLLIFCGLHKSLAQASEILQAPAQERTARLWVTVRDLGRDSTRIYQTCDSIMEQSDADGLLYAYAEFLKFNTQKFLRFDTLPKRIDFLQSKQAHFLRSPHPEIRGIYYHMLSMALMRNYNFKEAFEMTFRARRFFEQVGYENIPIAAIFLNQEFFTSYYFEDYRAAVEYSILTEKYDKHHVLGIPYLLSNRGEAYMRLGDYPKAKRLFLQALEQAEALGKMSNVGVSSGNYGKILRLQGKYQEALPYLYRNIAINEQRIPRSAASSYLEIAYCLIELDSMDKANSCTERAQELANPQSKSDWAWGVYGADFFKTSYYEAKSRYYEKAGNYNLSLEYKDSLIVLKDTLARRFDDKILMKAEARRAAENYLREIDRIELEKASAVKKRNIIVLAIAIVAMMLLYLLNYRHRRERQIEELERKRAEEMLAHANEQLAVYIENIKNKNALIEKMSADLESSEVWVSASANAEKHTEELRQQVILTEDDWQQFKKMFERVHPQFFQNLEEMPGEFSPAEIRLLALMRLDFSSKETAFMLGISVESLRKARYRLRKKVKKLPTDIHLSDLVEQL